MARRPLCGSQTAIALSVFRLTKRGPRDATSTSERSMGRPIHNTHVVRLLIDFNLFDILRSPQSQKVVRRRSITINNERTNGYLCEVIYIFIHN